MLKPELYVRVSVCLFEAGEWEAFVTRNRGGAGKRHASAEHLPFKLCRPGFFLFVETIKCWMGKRKERFAD